MDVTFPLLPLSSVFNSYCYAYDEVFTAYCEISQRLDLCLCSIALKHLFTHACYCTVVETHLKEKNNSKCSDRECPMKQKIKKMT